MKKQFIELRKMVHDFISAQKDCHERNIPVHSEKVEHTLQSLERIGNFQNKKLTDLEDRGRRSNLIIHGSPECPNETDATLQENVVKQIFTEKLGVKGDSNGRIHRLGKQTGKRPIFLHVQNFNEKEVLLENAKKLKGSKVSFDPLATFLYDEHKGQVVTGKSGHEYDVRHDLLATLMLRSGPVRCLDIHQDWYFVMGLYVEHKGPVATGK